MGEFIVSLSTEIAQFLQAGTRLVETLYAIHDLDDDAEFTDSWDTDAVAAEFGALGDRLSQVSAANAESLTQPDRSKNVRDACEVIIKNILCRFDILKQLNEHKLPHIARNFRELWPREDVDALEERLKSIIATIESEAEYLPSTQSKKLVATREALDALDITKDHRDQDEPDTQHEDGKLSARKNAMSLFGKNPGQKKSILEDEKTYTKETLFSDQEMILRDFLLESLKFGSMTDREDSVAVAHDGTFDWILAADGSGDHNSSSVQESLVSWLSSGNNDGIFWVSGKPGSGKSTLMRFLMSHPTTKKFLATWAGEEPLITAGFYFWISGTLEQRSQTGLMRHLLVQLLDQESHLVPVVFPARWKHLRRLTTRERIKATVAWDLKELKDALRWFMQHTAGEAKVCLFIDGLDEFAGNHEDVISFLQELVSSFTHLKLCLSSRPLPVFREAFGKNPKLELHDCTRQDMLDYSRDHLSANLDIQSLFSKDPEKASQLIVDIVDRADGVFLWAALAVQSLLRRSHLDFTQLHESLFQHPTDIDDLFTFFIFEQATTDQTTTISRIFQLLNAREDACNATGQEEAITMQLWELALADQVKASELSIPEDVQQASDEQIQQICSLTTNRFTNECAGLIVTHRPSPSTIRVHHATTPSPAQLLAQRKVTYVHRTVKDYLSRPEIWTRLTHPLKDTFDPHHSLLASHILQLKHPLDPFTRHRQIDEWWPAIPLAFTHARLSPSPEPELLLIPAYDTALCQHWSFRATAEADHWAKALFSTYEMRKRAAFEQPLLSLAAKFGLARLIRERIRDGTLRPLPAADPVPIPPPKNPAKQHTPQDEDKPDADGDDLTPEPKRIIRDLLEAGIDPNQPYINLQGRTRTPWIDVLEGLREAERRRWLRYYDVDPQGMGRVAEIVRLFVEFGADVNAVVPADRWDPEASAVDVVGSVWRGLAAWEFGALRGMLVGRGGVGVRERVEGVFFRVFGG
ncbi:hypothetical protein ASPACDRAFT_58583 [Aspergillus aculeatus ATCC 16872]|uniref:Uncharacterized protein n=1 Tax=Aspergillus aculeatus (strain ATCC 16872 / CBS 172.66 / WB 5094) TaxID=690307 RepID=A0A1L9X140_ASPA1|nr:uncharacterized protein ASPACDRAFT_58583 [Aspergillus aculeatus ATCC 16872]OJK02235.1 hypothetical protein ASPACDRAFT_58583 [Aspergillus aculeatus ATCC 16872]